MAPRCGIRRVSRRGLRPRGGRDTVCAMHSGKSINLIGVPGLQFYQNLKAGSHVAPLWFARRRHKKTGVIAGNARALTVRAMKWAPAGYERRRPNGAPFTSHPAAKPHRDRVARGQRYHSSTFFGSLDKMQDVIMRMLHNGEMPIAKTFEWLRPP